jgi:23S rRNA pseudouridine2605 synthase
MRLNKFIASATGKSRREADDLIAAGRVQIDGKVASLGAQIDNQQVTLDGKKLALPAEHTFVMLNKPVGYVSSRNAQAKDAKTLYELLPPELQKLKTVGRLDRDSSGLILLTDDGDFAFSMTHPKFAKTKIYEVELDKSLEPLHQQMISDFGINLPDGKSQLILSVIASDSEAIQPGKISGLPRRTSSPRNDRTRWTVTMHEGRNRQIRRTFAALGYTVTKLHRTDFGNYHLGDLKMGKWIITKQISPIDKIDTSVIQ